MTRNVRIYYASPEQILFWLTAFDEMEAGRCHTYPKLDLPCAARVSSCFYTPSLNQWGFLVEHESFEPVEDFIEPPIHRVEVRICSVDELARSLMEQTTT